MKHIAVILLVCLTLPAFSQRYPFVENFVYGTVVMKDSSQKKGEIKWQADQTQKLRFQENETSDIKKFSPNQLRGFRVDSLIFVSLFDFEAYAENFSFLGESEMIPSTFGQLLHSGRFNVYLVQISGYDRVNGALQMYSNYLFERKNGDHFEYAPFPNGIRVNDKIYDRAKAKLAGFFEGYPEIMAKINSISQESDFSEVLDLIKGRDQ